MDAVEKVASDPWISTVFDSNFLDGSNQFTSGFEQATKINFQLRYHPKKSNNYPKADIYIYEQGHMNNKHNAHWTQSNKQNTHWSQTTYGHYAGSTQDALWVKST